MQHKLRPTGWKKRYLLGGDRNKEKVIGQPVLVETTLEDGFLEKLQPVQSPTGETSASQSPPPPTTPLPVLELPPLQFEPSDNNPRISTVSDVPTASSIYTRPSPEFRYDFDPQSQVSPLFVAKRKPVPPDSPKTSSQEDGFDASSRDKHTQDLKSETYLRPSFAERAKQAGMATLGVETVNREWEGASGWTSRLTPITATPSSTVRSGSISPVESQSKVDYFPYKPSDEYPTPQSGPYGIRKDDSAVETPKAQISQTFDHQLISPPSSESGLSSQANANQPEPVSRFSWSTHPTEAGNRAVYMPSTPKTPGSFDTWTNNSPYSFRSNQTEDTPSRVVHQQNASSSIPGLRFASTGAVPNPNIQPVSRFSWTTEATSEPSRANPSPAGSPQRKAVPRSASPTTIDTAMQETAHLTPFKPTPGSPIMNRRRPVPPSSRGASSPVPGPETPQDPNSRQIPRKPTPSTITALTAASTSTSATTSPINKTLPATPTHLSAVDHIMDLQAILVALKHRRHNLAKLIASLNALFGPNNPMVVDLEKRRSTREKVDELELELAEVKRQEHEVGLKLMRAERRRDQETPSALWIRRITTA